MTTIVTVHGTFANHEDDAGEQWWQTGSDFQKEVTARLDVGISEPDWVPFHWSGANSEIDRRSGGEALFDFLKENFEDKDRPYHLVGHSHGGSVIAEALRYSTRRKTRLENLRSWITVATPFLAFKKQKRLFSRVKRRYQLLLAIITAYILAVLLAVPIGMCDNSIEAKGCWVEKSHSNYLEFYKIKHVYSDLTLHERTQLPILGTPAGSVKLPFNRLKKSGGINQERRVHAQSVNLTLLETEAKNQTGSEFSPELELNVIVSTFKQQNPAKLSNAKHKSLALLRGSKLAAEIRKLAHMEHDTTGVFPLDMCATENHKFYSLADHAILRYHEDTEGTPVAGAVFEGVTSIHEARINAKSYMENVFEMEFADLREYCAKSKTGHGLDDEILHWGRSSFSFKDPKTLTFFAKYENGKRRILRLQFDNLAEIKIIPFIPRSEAILSLGFLMYLAITSIPVLIATSFLWRSQKFLRRRYAPSKEGGFVAWYKAKWIKLSHPEDEAINAIAASTKAKISMAPPDMLQGVFMLVFSSVMAILLIFHGVKWINWILPEQAASKLGFKRELIEELGYAINKAQDVTNGSGTFSGNNLTGWKAELPLTIFFNDDGGLGIVSLLIVFGLILLGFIFIGRMFEKLVLNPVLKKGIDGIAQGSAVSGAFGDDALGEEAAQCAAHPWEFKAPYTGEFPEPVRRAVETHANKDLIDLPGKFRAALHKNVSSAHDFSLSDLLEGDMGEILLHTSYFNVKEFHDLFAAALISSGDFKRGKSFKNHKEASKWFANLTAASPVTTGEA